MSPEAEAYLIILVYVLIVTVPVLFAIIVYLLVTLKKKNDRDDQRTEFERLMVQLYEIERLKNERQGEGGFGT